MSDDIVVVDNGQTYETSESEIVAKNEADRAEQWAKYSEEKANLADERAIDAAESSDAAAQAATAAIAAKEYAENAITDNNLITVATDLKATPSNIKTVAGSIASVNTVSENIDIVNSVAGNATNINAVSANRANIDTVADNIDSVNDVAMIKDDVVMVSGSASDIMTVADNVADVKNVSNNMQDVKKAVVSAANAKASEDNAKISENHAQTWAEGEDPDVAGLGGTHSAKKWAELAGSLVNVQPASETTSGIVRLSTTEEAKEGFDDSTAITPLKLAQVVADNVGRGIQLGFNGTLEGNVLTFETTDSSPYTLRHNYDYEIDLLFQAVGILPDDVEVVIKNGSDYINIVNVLHDDPTTHITVGDIRQIMKYNDVSGWRWVFMARYAVAANGNKVFVMPSTVVNISDYVIYDYDFRANSPRFIEAKILKSEYKNKTYIQAATANATDIFDKTSFVIHPCSIRLNVNGVSRWYVNERDTTIMPSSILDSGSALQAGKDYYIYLVPDGAETKIICSLNASYPSGFTAENSRKIGGFHTLCVNSGTLSNNIASGYAAGNIIPNSIWCLGFRPAGDTRGAAYIDVLDKWGHIYLQSGTGANTTSAYGATITDTRYPQAHIEDMLAIGYCLPGDSEFTAMAWGSNKETNINGSTDPVTTGGHTDTKGMRMISTYFLEDCCGALWQWLSCASANGGSGWNEINYTGGDFYANCLVLLAGGRWGDGAHCGWGSRYGNYGRSTLSASHSARGLSQNIRLTSQEL